jgi:hypothetical protein
MRGFRKPLALSMAAAATGGTKNGLEGETLALAVYRLGPILCRWDPISISRVLRSNSVL